MLHCGPWSSFNVALCIIKCCPVVHDHHQMLHSVSCIMIIQCCMCIMHHDHHQMLHCISWIMIIIKCWTVHHPVLHFASFNVALCIIVIIKCCTAHHSITSLCLVGSPIKTGDIWTFERLYISLRHNVSSCDPRRASSTLRWATSPFLSLSGPSWKTGPRVTGRFSGRANFWILQALPIIIHLRKHIHHSSSNRIYLMTSSMQFLVKIMHNFLAICFCSIICSSDCIFHTSTYSHTLSTSQLLFEAEIKFHARKVLVFLMSFYWLYIEKYICTHHNWVSMQEWWRWKCVNYNIIWHCHWKNFLHGQILGRRHWDADQQDAGLWPAPHCKLE